MTPSRIREVLRAAMRAPSPHEGNERVGLLLTDRRIDRLLAALDAAGLEIREKGK